MPCQTRPSFMVATLVALSAGAASLPAAAAVNDVLPTDYVALPDGSNNLSLYGLKQRMTGPWRDGRLSSRGELDVNLFAVRLSRTFALGEQGQYALAPVLVLPWADGESSSNLPAFFGLRASGQGDVRLGLTFWPHVDRVQREYSAVSAFISLPTGDYNPLQILNPGENRTRLVLSGGWLRQLGKHWVTDIVSEVAFYGDNQAYLGDKVLHQDVSYALTGWLRYRITPSLHWMGGAQLNRGGASRTTDATVSNGAPNNTRLSTGLMLFTADQQQWILRYSRDATVDNGFRLADEFTLRYSVSFK